MTGTSKPSNVLVLVPPGLTFSLGRGIEPLKTSHFFNPQYIFLTIATNN